MSLLSIALGTGLSAHVDEDFLRDSARTYRALFDLADDENFVLANCGLGVYQRHPTDPQQRLVDLKATLLAPHTVDPGSGTAANLWEIVATYGQWDPLRHSYDGNPVHMPTRFRVDFTTAEIAAFEDVDGNPIVNSAGDPYDPPLMREVTRGTLTVQRNEQPSAVNLATLAALSNTINVAVWNGFPAKTVRLAPLKLPDIQYCQVTNAYYFPMEYTFDINFDTWVRQVINAGFRELDGSGNLKPILIAGQPATVPVPLDESGHALLTPTYRESTGDVPNDSDSGGASGEVAGGGEPPSGGTGVWSSTSSLVIDAYDLIRTADFSQLNMDNLFNLPPIF